MFRKALIWICLFAFLPSAVGCSTRRTIAIDADPAEQPPVQLEEPVHIEGYTLRDGSRLRWEGSVVSVTPDSLEFRSSSKDHLKKGATFGQETQPAQEQPLVFRLASDDVAELHAVKGRFVPSLLLALLGLVALTIVGMATSDPAPILGN